MLFAHELSGGVFQQQKIPDKNLPLCLYVSYQLCCVYRIMIYTQKVPAYVSTTFSPRSKVITVFAPELSALLCLHYRVIYAEFVRVYFQYPPQHKKLPRCLYISYQVIMSVVHILPHYLHKSYQWYVFNKNNITG